MVTTATGAEEETVGRRETWRRAANEVTPMKLSQTILTALSCAVMGLSLTAHAAVIDGDENHHNLPAVPLATNQYLITNVTVNAGSGAPNKDANLVNPWGLSPSSGSPWCVSDKGRGLGRWYRCGGCAEGVVVWIPPAKAGRGNQGTPTGTVFNGTQEFALPN